MTHDIFHRGMIALLPLCLVLATLMGWGCGRHPARAKEQVQGQVAEYPSYPVRQDQKAFTLTEGAENTVTYRTGTLLLLNPAFDPADLANLMQISKEIRLARADAVHYATAGALKASQDQKDIAATEGQIKQKRLEISQKVARDTRLANAAVWFDAEMKNVVKDPLAYTNIMDTFAGYCEAKIWQLAAQPYFAGKRYLKRPTPLALCEKYYKDKGFFAADAASCADAPDSQGKYFVACLWAEGVMKTALFQHHFMDKNAAFTGLLSDSKREDFRMILASAMNNKTDPLLVSPRLSGKIHTAIMGLKKLNARCAVKLFEIKLSEMCTLFVSSNPPVIPTDGSVMATWDMPPAGLVDLVENNKAAMDVVGDTLVTIPRQFVLPARPAGQIPYQNLILFFAVRAETAPSESDTIFHLSAVADNVPAAGISAIASLPDQTAAVDDYRAALGSIYPKTTPADEAVILDLQNKIKALENDILETESGAGRYDKKVTDLLNAGISAAKASDLAYAFTNMGLQITKKNDVYTLEFWFGDDSRSAGDQKKRAKGCYDTFARTSLANATCLDHADYQLSASQFTYQPDTGELRFTFPFDQADKMGFKAPGAAGNSATTNDYFNTIPLAAFAGTSMEFQLFPNTIGGVVNILTGKVFVKQKGWKDGDAYLYEGVVSIFDNK